MHTLIAVSTMLQRTNKLVLTLVASLCINLVAITSVMAQDEPGRYRPQGREFARQIGNHFDEALYEVRTYDPQPDVPEFAAATIFYPLTLSFAAPMGAVVMMPGYTGVQEAYDWWGPTLASLGIAVMIIDTNTPTDTFQPRRAAHIAAVEFLRGVNTDSDSPLAGKLDLNKLAIMGHSLAGGASLVAAEELGSGIKAVVPLLPYCCELGESFEGDYSGLDVPTLIIASAVDTVAAPEQHARALFDSIADRTPKAYVEFKEGTHTMTTNGGSDLQAQAHFVFAWLRSAMSGEPKFAAAFEGDGGSYADRLSRFD